ncbi:MAG: translation initiation factor IF-3 [Bacillariaceae sp.]|jgi:translation initiation factor IF-3
MPSRPLLELAYTSSARVVAHTRTRTVPINCRSRSVCMGKEFAPSSSSSLISVIRSFSGGESSYSPSLHKKSPIWQDVNSRLFSSRGRNSKGFGNNKKKSNVLANEDLVALLIRKSSESSADSLTIRLVTDEGPDTPSTVQVISLSEAIEISLDRGEDLIGANIDGDPPVIRVTQLSKLEYKHHQAQKKQQNSSSNKKEKKAFRFKAGIDKNDLERKLGRLKEFLIKGHDCDFTVFSRLRTLRQNPDAGGELVEQIRVLLADVGEMKRPPQTDETKKFYRVNYQPKSGSVGK